MPVVTPWNATRFAMKHVVAAAVVIGGLSVAAAVSFVGLFLLALFPNGSLGSPVAVPVMVLSGLAIGVATVVFVLTPATIVTELVCAQARLRVWWQIPMSTIILIAAVLTLTAMNVASGRGTLHDSTSIAAIASGILLIALGVYWWALQSTDWLLRTGGHLASLIWPARFGALSTRPELTIGGRPVAVRAHFRTRKHFHFATGYEPALVIIGDIVDGDVRRGMRICANVGSSELSATIASVEHVDGTSTGSQVGLMLSSLNAGELERWKAAASEGRVLTIA